MIGHVPAAVAAGHNIDKSGVVAFVAVVVIGKQIAVLVYGQLLRIPKTAMDEFQFGSIWIAAKDCSVTRVGDGRSLFGLDVCSPIAHRKVQPAIHAPHQSVQIVPVEGRINSKACQQRCFSCGGFFAVGVFQQPEIGNARVPDVAISRDQPGTETIQWSVESIGEDGGDIGLAVPIAVLQLPHNVAGLSEPCRSACKLVCPLFLHCQSIRQRPDLQIIVKQKTVTSILRRPLKKSMIFRDVHAPLIVETERHRILQLRLCGKQFHGHSGGDTKGRHLRCRRLCSVLSGVHCVSISGHQDGDC